MDSGRRLALIVACALFIENMDSSAIATALPAIAADLGTEPIALKLALTAYLMSLAVFIPIIGPPLGGLLVTFGDWRWIFLINIPIGLLGIALAQRFIPDIREPATPLDARGFALSGLGLALACWAGRCFASALAPRPSCCR